MEVLFGENTVQNAEVVRIYTGMKLCYDFLKKALGASNKMNF